MTAITRRNSHHSSAIYDVLYGFIPITAWEEKIINSPLFQRLRWIKQLGFANYIFPGAEHNRFAHVIGVMHSMDQMIRSLGLSVPDQELFDPKATNPAAMFHKTLRIAALLHDIGTFPFSHAVENGYLRHGNDHRRPGTPKDLPNSHEHLGSFIIKNTDYAGGITRILNEYGFDGSLLSKIIKGESHSLISNQLMHSELDADRMDYLIRDAHYTGIKYGQFDREYILANLLTFKVGGKLAFGVSENAMYAVEDFLISRFSWYSQIIRNRQSAKFDIIAANITHEFLDQDLMPQFQDLLSMVEERDERFFWWNDVYFMNRCQEIFYQKLTQDVRVLELTDMLLYRRAPKTVNHPLLAHKILKADPKSMRERVQLIGKIQKLLGTFDAGIEKQGTGKEWILADIPKSDIAFARGLPHLRKKSKGKQLHLERDPVRIVSKDGNPSLLVEHDNTLIKHLSGFANFIPSVYANEPALALLQKRKLIAR
ncbi:MAG: hypothetical protein A2Z97_07115 [Bdellovibrionales bacterium GWB1_52_6]|nr:MAG: hypothetical protein A2Z97_07115 [Bdellovibrionales bacterium GWB1_52_6]OFZ06290.1 MAG: hypothetical protein A2X97_02390 [Bdellovibrionales bacterium GWA1_52_35]HCM40039.1 hypothetical protein [Bdellovibrionales bacterium]